ncbi:hypothetical protein GGR38_003540 [Novosphingobium sediminicola]|uniref:Uncharacterized protein n=2 Tax=Novosphingobium sediminicola TaxID=563162 RepID=A0A7W6G7V8_9SPHN|nr:hypothetical protein [Novosphingobium sediminicola]
MTQRTNTPTKALTMTISEWRLRLAELCRDCVLSDSDDEGDCLRLAHALMMQAPESRSDVTGLDLSVILSHLPPVARIECLIEQGALDSVALALLPEEASYLMSRSIDGAWLASVFLPGMEEDMTSEGSSLAMALTSALLASLAHVAQPAGASAVQSATITGTARCDGDVWPQGGDAYAESIWQRPAGTLLN